MKINDILNEDYGYSPGNTGGYKIFINNLTNEIFSYIDSVRKSNQPLEMETFVDSYLKKYGWVPTPQQQQTLAKAAKEVESEYYFLQKQQGQQAQTQQAQTQQAQQEPTEPTPQDAIAAKRAEKLKAAGASAQSQMAPFSKMPNPAVWRSNRTGQPMKMNEGIADWAMTKVGKLWNKMGFGSVKELANAIYAVGQVQQRDPRTGQVLRPATQPGQQNQQKQDDTTIDPAGKQVISSVKKLKGPQYEKDLEEIVKLALWNLYGTSKEDYSDFVRQIMTQKTSAKNPMQQQQQQPNPQA